LISLSPSINIKKDEEVYLPSSRVGYMPKYLQSSLKDYGGDKVDLLKVKKVKVMPVVG
jgi:hypothetical protein